MYHHNHVLYECRICMVCSITYTIHEWKCNALNRTIEAKVNVWIKLFEACKTGVNLYENPLTLCVLLLFLRDGKSDYSTEKIFMCYTYTVFCESELQGQLFISLLYP